jgi:hypothetical protein
VQCMKISVVDCTESSHRLPEVKSVMARQLSAGRSVHFRLRHFAANRHAPSWGSSRPPCTVGGLPRYPPEWQVPWYSGSDSAVLLPFTLLASVPVVQVQVQVCFTSVCGGQVQPLDVALSNSVPVAQDTSELLHIRIRCSLPATGAGSKRLGRPAVTNCGCVGMW